MRNTFLLLLILVFSSCEWESSTTANNNIVKTLSEEQVINKTMADFYAETTNQNEIDRNLILNHIIDNKLDMESTPDGIYYQITKEGIGNHPTINSTIVTNYNGTFLDGKIFDSTTGKKPLTYPLSRMNDGWKKAIPLMKSGGKAIFIIPSRLGYGEEGFGDLIPPNTVLRFEVELIGIKGTE
ncbi:MAG: FKBP-type peptidyl-prolyl cis-trans isomerase [Saprospiraceae bacterium]